MNSNSNADNSKLSCEGITRKPIEDVDDLDFHKDLAKAFSVLPLFEKKLYDYSRQKHYSFETNELLSCRWRRFISRLGEEPLKKSIKQFPSVDDFHFCNCCTRFLPSLSIKNMPPPCFSLIPGPGVDKYGPLPIPNDMQLRVSQPDKNLIKIFL